MEPKQSNVIQAGTVITNETDTIVYLLLERIDNHDDVVLALKSICGYNPRKTKFMKFISMIGDKIISDMDDD